MFHFISHRPGWAIGLILSSAAGCVPARTSPRPPTASDPAALEADAAPPDLSRDAVLRRDRLTCAVVASNPELAAWRDTWRMASSRVDQPTSLGTTSIAYSFAPGSIGSDAVRYGQLVQIEQSFRLGQTKLERRVARAEADAVGHGAAAKRQQLVLLTTTLYDEYYALTRALQTNAEHEQLVTTILDVATARYSTGQAPQQDPLAAELELAHIEHEAVVLQSQRAVVAAQINGLLHRPPDTPLPPPPDELDKQPRPRAEAETRRPETAAALADEEAAEHATKLARRRYSPSIRAMASYSSMWPRVEHQFMVGAGITIPLQVRSLRAAVVEAEAGRSAARHRRAAIEDAVSVQQASARHEVEQARHVVELHRARLVPTARARVEAAQVGYETGANDFSAVLEAERELRTLDLDYHRALATLADKRAELDHALGRTPDCDESEVGR